jgi:hypothetical protein
MGSLTTTNPSVAASAVGQHATVRREQRLLDERLDEALAETFPASDPIAVTPVRIPAKSHEGDRK